MNRLTVLILLITIMLFSCEIRFSSSEPGVPSETLASLITIDISGITTSTASGGGNITSDGGSSVTSRGVVWSVNPAPTTSLTTKTVDGSGTGSFPSSIKSLASNTKYYVRAYAVNGVGTAYGNEVSFTTSGTASIPMLTTTAISGVTTSTASGGGNITSDGGSAVTSRGVVWSVNPAPTTSLTTKTVDGSGTGSFPSSIKGLASNTKYYVRAYAVNSSGTAYGNEVSFNTLGPCQGASTVKDIDGNTYNTVQIGTQCWTKENLRVTKYSDGTSIPLDNSGGTSGNGSGQTWSSRTTGARTIYAHSQTNLATYGYLYNWYAAKGIATTGSTSYKNLCPTGWHVPTDAEWTTLSTFLRGVNVAGGKLKSVTGWNAPNTGATNESGFTGLPGGGRDSDGEFYYLGTVGVWWSSSESNSGLAWSMGLDKDYGNVYRNSSSKGYGFSVRCLRD